MRKHNLDRLCQRSVHKAIWTHQTLADIVRNHGSQATLAASLLLPFIIIFAVSGDANAAANSSDWTKPATGIIDTLKSGLVTIGALVVGLAVIGYGIWQALQPEPNFKRLGMIIFGGVCIMAGPQAIAAILAAAQ